MDIFYKPKHPQGQLYVHNHSDNNEVVVRDKEGSIVGNFECDAYPKDYDQINAYAELFEAAPELLETLFWISRSLKIKGPAGTTAYLIPGPYITKAKELVKKLTKE